MDPALYEAAINGRHSSTNSLRGNSTGTADSNAGSLVQAVTFCQRNTTLHVATIGGNEKFVEKILKSNPALSKETNTRGETALHIAARLGYLKVATLLVTYATQVDCKNDVLMMANDHEKNTVLHEAVRNGHYDIVEFLLKENPSLACLTNGAGESPLFMAVDRKFYKIAHHILKYFPDCSFSGRNGMTIMHAAVLRLRYISFYFYNPHQINPQLPFMPKVGIVLRQLRITSLNILILGFKQACQPCTTEEDFVENILEKYGPEILDVEDNYGWLPLHYVARIGNEKILKLFLEKNRSLAYRKDKKGMSALHILVENGRNSTVDRIIEICPDVCELRDNRGRTALHVAAETGFDSFRVTNLLRKAPFRDLINEKDEEGNTALHLAAIHGKLGTLRRLANDKRVDKGAINKDGMTVIDIIESSTKLTHDRKVSMLTILKRKGLQPSLEKRVLLGKKTTDQKTVNDETKENEITPETDQLTSKEPSKNEQAPAAASTSTTYAQEKREKKSGKKRRKLVKTLAYVNLLVATIITSITFSAVMTMPGGYDNTDGMAILRAKNSFRIFLVSDSLAFGCSAASICIHFLVAFTSRCIIETYSYPIFFVVLLTLLSIGSTVIAFITGTNAVLRHRSGFGLSAYIAVISFIVPVSFFFLRLVVVLLKRLRSYISSRK